MDAFEKSYNRSLRFLSYRPRSEKEVRDNLLRHSSKPRRTRRIQNQILKQVQDDQMDSGQARMTVIEQVIAKLKKNTFLNDEEFAKWWVEQRTIVRPKAVRVIRSELRLKGVASEIVEEILSNEDIKILGKEMVKKLIEKRLSRYEGLEPKEKRKKMAEHLARRGFDYETIKDALDEVLGREYNNS